METLVWLVIVEVEVGSCSFQGLYRYLVSAKLITETIAKNYEIYLLQDLEFFHVSSQTQLSKWPACTFVILTHAYCVCTHVWMTWLGAALCSFDAMKRASLGEAQWDVHSKVFHVYSNNLLLISAAFGFLCVSEHTMASVLLLFFFFFQSTERLDSYFGLQRHQHRPSLRCFPSDSFVLDSTILSSRKARGLWKIQGTLEWTEQRWLQHHRTQSNRPREHKTHNPKLWEALAQTRSSGYAQSMVIVKPFCLTDGMLRSSAAKEMHKLTKRCTGDRKWGKMKKEMKWLSERRKDWPCIHIQGISIYLFMYVFYFMLIRLCYTDYQ